METIYLVGAEDVRNAGHRMADAAQRMEQAASSFDFAVTRIERALETHAQLLEQILKEHADRTTFTPPTA